MTRLVLRPREQETQAPRSPILRGLHRLVEEGSMIRPHFSGCWVIRGFPSNAEVINEYDLPDAKVRILSLPGGVRAFYHLTPWEYELPPDQVGMIIATIEILSNSPPDDVGASIDELKAFVKSRSAEIIRDLSGRRGTSHFETGNARDVIDRLARVITRYTVGLGLFETLLTDDRIEDIYVDAPAAENQVHVTINGISGMNTVVKCRTNLIANEREIDGLVSRFRQYSRRPFSEAFPIMETDVQGFEARATVIGPPLSPMGTGIALRRHSRTPWTLTRLAFNGTLDCLAAGLVSFLIDGRSTVLICGPRGAGKSALLSAILFEFPVSQRILTIEDTLELPVREMQRMGYKIQSMLVEQEIGVDKEEKTDEALRVSLRLGESAIVLGEVRGKEAHTLYQSMRTGRAGSSVLGTIHGDSARSVYERVVHDIGIPKEAFGATDIVLTMGLNRPRGTQRQIRRLIEVAELAKEKGAGEFNMLMQFDHSRGKLSALNQERSETIARVAESWNMSYGEALENIQARATMRGTLVKLAGEGHIGCLGPEWVCLANEFFWRQMNAGTRDYGQIPLEFEELVRRRIGVGRAV